LLLLPLAAAASLIVIVRDELYAYEYSEAGARAIADRVAKLNGELIQIDFDRQNQWNDLVDMELRANDLHAARGFLLSGAGMLPRRSAGVLRQSDASDAELEVAALQLLAPNTRARYVAAGRLLSDQRTQARPTAATQPSPIGDQADFELMARSLMTEPDAEQLQFILTGYSLGLAGDLSPRMAAGAAVLLEASRRDDYPAVLGEEINALFAASMPLDRFRAAARSAERDAGAYANAAAAFSQSLVPEHATRARSFLDTLGAISEATSRTGAAALLTHASSLRDMPRMNLLVQAAGDRAVAAAKRLPRDGRLLDAARGQLTMNRDLTIALGVAAAAALGLILILVLKLVQGALTMWRRYEDEAYAGGELVEISSSNWRPL